MIIKRADAALLAILALAVIIIRPPSATTGC
jgi:hypothetical protein